MLLKYKLHLNLVVESSGHQYSDKIQCGIESSSRPLVSDISALWLYYPSISSSKEKPFLILVHSCFLLFTKYCFLPLSLWLNPTNSAVPKLTDIATGKRKNSVD